MFSFVAYSTWMPTSQLVLVPSLGPAVVAAMPVVLVMYAMYVMSSPFYLVLAYF